MKIQRPRPVGQIQKPLNPASMEKDRYSPGELLARIRKLSKALDQAQEHQRELLLSTSWRITWPLRAIKNWLGGLSRRSREPEIVEYPMPEIPIVLRRDQAQTLGETIGQSTFRLIDGSDAMRPLLQDRPSTATNLNLPRIGFIGSQELARELEFNAHIVCISEINWFKQVRSGELDYLLVEPTWETFPGEWRYVFVDENKRGRLIALLRHCRDISLPIVVWFRVDLSDYSHYAWLGEHGDLLYGIDDDICAQLLTDYPERTVGCLPPAIQPALYNPIRTYALQDALPTFEDNILIDALWGLLTDGKLKRQVLSLDNEVIRVCESRWDVSWHRIKEQPDLAVKALGCVDILDRISLGKLCGRELLVSGFSGKWRQHLAAMRAIATDSMPFMNNESASSGSAWMTQSIAYLGNFGNDILARSATIHPIRRELLRSSCLSNRLDSIQNILSMPVVANDPLVTVILVTMRPHLLAACLARFRNDLYKIKELVVILHGEHDLSAARALVLPDEPIQIHRVGTDRGLGGCINFAVSLGKGEYWAKMDDDDYYGPYYLTDLMLSRRMHDFDVTGKPLSFTYLESEDALYWDPVWHRFTHILHSPSETAAVLVSGATLAGKRSVLEAVPFSERRRGGADSNFIRQCYKAGFDVLASDAFNFACHRSSATDFHTWRMDELAMKTRSRHLGDLGSIRKEVFL